MKKITTMILAAAMVLTMAGLMTACGSDADSGESSKEQTTGTSSTTDTGSAASEGSVFPAALSKVQAYPVSDLSNTGWELTGGMIDGVEMEQSDLDEMLKACGGTLQFIFTDESTVIMVNGEKNFDGSYEVIKDNYAVHATFTGYEYYGVFTEIDGMTIMILANKTAPETALYMTQIDEH